MTSCALSFLHHAASTRSTASDTRYRGTFFGYWIDFLFRLDDRCPPFVCGAYIWRIMAGKIIFDYDTTSWLSFILRLRAFHLRLYSSLFLPLNIGDSLYLGCLLRLQDQLGTHTRGFGRGADDGFHLIALYSAVGRFCGDIGGESTALSLQISSLHVSRWLD